MLIAIGGCWDRWMSWQHYTERCRSGWATDFWCCTHMQAAAQTFLSHAGVWPYNGSFSLLAPCCTFCSDIRLGWYAVVWGHSTQESYKVFRIIYSQIVCPCLLASRRVSRKVQPNDRIMWMRYASHPSLTLTRIKLAWNTGLSWSLRFSQCLFFATGWGRP